MWMSVWPAHAVRSVPTSTVPTSATADRATTSGRMGTPVKVRHDLLHITNTMFMPGSVFSDTFASQFYTRYFLVLVFPITQTSTSVPKAPDTSAPINVWMFQAATSVLVLNMATPCLQMDAHAEVNTLHPTKPHVNTLLTVVALLQECPLSSGLK